MTDKIEVFQVGGVFCTDLDQASRIRKSYIKDLRIHEKLTRVLTSIDSSDITIKSAKKDILDLSLKENSDPYEKSELNYDGLLEVSCECHAKLNEDIPLLKEGWDRLAQIMQTKN